MSNITITVELKPSQELVTLFAPVVAAVMPKVAPQIPVAKPATPAPIVPPTYAYPAAPVIPQPNWQTPLAANNGAHADNPAYAAPVPQAPVNPTYAPTQGAPLPATPVMTSSTSAPISTPTTFPSNPAPVQQTAPTAAAPAFTFDDLSRAAAQLMDAGKQQELLSLLGQFSIQSMQHLPKERYGEFATALRQLGARI